MRGRALLPVLLPAVFSVIAPSMATAQPLGTFTWQLQPFCNRVTVNVRQDGSVYTLDGFDDQCGASQRAALVGLATANPDGSVALGLHIVASGGRPVSVDARIAVAGLSGTWTDSAGNSGAFAFGANSGGSPRPAPVAGLGDVTAVTAGTGLTGGGVAGDVMLAVNPSVVQSRVGQACPAGQAVRAIAENGTVTCEPVSGGTGDITAVLAGTGLTGGATSGDATLAVAFGGPGTANLAARSNHQHEAAGSQNTAVGNGLAIVTTGFSNVAIGRSAMNVTQTGSQNVAIGPQALATNTSGSNNVAIHDSALIQNSTGIHNIAIGSSALSTNTTGSFNIGIGRSTGFGGSNGTSNIMIGNAATTIGTLTNAVAIGENAQVAQSNALVIGGIGGVTTLADTDLGLGTAAPLARLHVAAVGGVDDILLQSTVAPNLVGEQFGGTRTTPAATTANSKLLQLSGRGHDGAAFTPDRAAIAAVASETWSATANGARLEFQTTANTTQALTTRMVIDHNGEVGIGTAAPADVLHVAGDVRVLNCVRNSGGTQIAGTCASDARFKRDITPFPEMLDKVALLRPVNYFWRAEQFPERGWGGGRASGLIAQEVEAVLPELVRTMDDGYKAVDYSSVPLLLLQAIRELKTRNDDLEARLTALEQQRTRRDSR